MSVFQCSCKSCMKVFEKPIVITNFVLTPTKETYSACPYCLTRIDDDAGTWDCVNTVEPVTEVHLKSEQEIRPEQKVTDEPCLKGPFAKFVSLERLEALEKEKEKLLLELEELKQGAMKKIFKLEDEIVALKEEKQALQELTS